MPLRILIPATLILLSFLQTTYTFWSSSSQIKEGIHKEVHKDLTLQLNQLQGNIEFLILHNHASQAQELITTLSSNTDIKAAFVIDQNNSILFSTRKDEIGHNLLQLAKKHPVLAESKTFNKLKRIRNLQRGVIEETQQMFIGMYPVKLSNKKSSIRRNTIGIIFILHDLKNLDDHTVDTLLYKLTPQILAIFIFVFLIWVLIYFEVTLPISKLLHATQRFSDGDEKSRTNLKGKTEVAILGQAFDQMADRVSSNQKQLQHMVEDRTIELKLALDESQAATRAKSEFLANMSHEIRTPMNGVLGMLSLLSDSSLNQEQQELANIALNSGETLLTILNDILDLSKIESGNLVLECTDFNIRQLIEDITALFAERAYVKGLELVCDLSIDTPNMVKGDPTRLRQIISNLLGNAIKFTEHGEVIVSTSVVGDEDQSTSLLIEIKDSGIGINKEAQSKIFDSFSQADSSTTRNYGGTGLGLTITSQLVNIMNGEIGVKSDIGKGSSFWFIIKFDKSLAEEPLFEPDHNLQIYRTLIVDDNKTNRTILKYYLSHWQIPYETASSGESAIEKMHQAAENNTPYKLVLLDMMMPEMDGLDVAIWMRNNNDYKSTYIIMLTSVINKPNDSRLNSAKIDASFTKPVRPSILFDNIITVTASTNNNLSKKISKTSNVIPHQSAKILIVEDNIVNQKVIKGILKKLNYDTHTVSNGQEAVDEVTKNHYDIILMDCQMPVMDGYLATKKIRALNKNNIIIIAMTAHAMQGDKEKCLASGMDDYLSKPIRLNRIIDLLKKWTDTDRNIINLKS